MTLLLLIGIASSKFSARLGVPVLVLFLAVGMLAGSEGIGRIPFKNVPRANNLSSAALALMLVDDGLHTSLVSVQRVWRQALSLSLSTVRISLTSAITGRAAAGCWICQSGIVRVTTTAGEVQTEP